MAKSYTTRGLAVNAGPRVSRCALVDNDLIAIGPIRRLAEQGVGVPDEVSVTGFDNIPWTDFVTPWLTTVARPVGAIGARAVELMQERMSGEKIDSQRTVFDVELIERDSVRKLNGSG